MKKYLLLICLVLGQLAVAQDLDKIGILERKIDSLYLLVDSLRMENNSCREKFMKVQSFNRYKMYPTENTYNLLELDTKTGIVKQVQWSLDDGDEGWWYINSIDLSKGDEYGSGTFELYPTKNIFQFILLDKTDGRKWHVQWGFTSKECWIKEIWKHGNENK